MRSSLASLKLLLPLALLLGAGCSTIRSSHDQKAPLMADYLQGNRAAALEEVDYRLREPHWYNTSVVGTGDEVMWRLESANLHFLAGQDDACIEQLDAAERLMEDYDARALVNLRSFGSEGTALATNENALPYRGKISDKMFYPVLRALAYLGKGDEAGFQVELRKLRENQQRVLDANAKLVQAESEGMDKQRKENSRAVGVINPSQIEGNSQNGELGAALAQTRSIASKSVGNYLNPLSLFLSFYGYRLEGDWQNAKVDALALWRALPTHPVARIYAAMALRAAGDAVPADLATLDPDKALAPDARQGRSILVIHGSGRIGALRQISLYLPVILPHYASVACIAFPVREYYNETYRPVMITSNGLNYQTLPVADMDAIVGREYLDRLPAMITRLCLSVAIKELSSYVLVETARQSGNDYAQLGVLAATIAYKALFNTADTRSWETLPKTFAIRELPVPANGKLTLSIPNTTPTTVTLSPAARGAILYINTPSSTGVASTCRVFELKKLKDAL